PSISALRDVSRAAAAAFYASAAGHVGDEPGLLDAVDHGELVFRARRAARAGGAENLALIVADQHASRLREKLAVGRRREADEEIRVLARPLGEHAARRAHRDRGPRLAGRDVEPEHARAVVALRGFEMTAVVEHDDGQRREAELARALDRLRDDRVRLLEREARCALLG